MPFCFICCCWWIDLHVEQPWWHYSKYNYICSPFWSCDFNKTKWEEPCLLIEICRGMENVCFITSHQRSLSILVLKDFGTGKIVYIFVCCVVLSLTLDLVSIFQPLDIFNHLQHRYSSGNGNITHIYGVQTIFLAWARATISEYSDELYNQVLAAIYKQQNVSTPFHWFEEYGKKMSWCRCSVSYSLQTRVWVYVFANFGFFSLEQIFCLFLGKVT